MIPQSPANRLLQQGLSLPLSFSTPEAQCFFAFRSVGSMPTLPPNIQPMVPMTGPASSLLPALPLCCLQSLSPFIYLFILK